MNSDSMYLSEGDWDASIQLNVICQLSELVLLLLKRLQQTVDLLLCQNNSAVVLKHIRSNAHHTFKGITQAFPQITTALILTGVRKKKETSS